MFWLVLYLLVLTNPRAHSRLWTQIQDVLPIVDFWSFGGDFNNFEIVDDWSAATPHVVSSISH